MAFMFGEQAMLIGGLQKNSFIDFPGHIAAVIFTASCNFRCPYCHNPDLIYSGGVLLDEEEVFSFLETRRGKLEGVVVSGGEPTVSPDLPAMCLKIKEMGFALKLDTNGSNPDMVEFLIARELVDYVAMDIKADPYAYPLDLAPGFEGKEENLTEALIKSIRLLAGCGLPCEFRTTCAAPFVTMHSMERIARALSELAPEVPLWLQKVNWRHGAQPDYPGAGQEPLESLQLLALKYIKYCEIR